MMEGEKYNEKKQLIILKKLIEINKWWKYFIVFLALAGISNLVIVILSIIDNSLNYKCLIVVIVSFFMIIHVYNIKTIYFLLYTSSISDLIRKLNLPESQPS